MKAMKNLPAWVFAACLVFSCTAVSPVALGQAPETPQPSFDITLPAGGLQPALARLSSLTGLQILYDPALVQGRFANQVQGNLTALQALARLLAPSDLTFQVTGPDAVALLASPPATGPSAAPGQPPEVRVMAPEPRFVAPTNRDQIGRIWAPVKINGAGPFRLVLDTGASRSALTGRTARQLGMPPQTEATRLYGVTGTALVPTVHVDTLEIGNLLVDTASLPVVGDVFGGADGVLGRDGLQNTRILADFRHDRLVIGPSHREAAQPGYMTIRLTLTPMGLLAADARVGSVRTTAIIDTGAQATLGNLALRDALMRSRPPQAQTTRVLGVTLDVQSGDRIPSPPIVLGPLKVSGVKVTFGDMSLFEHWHLTHQPAVLIGMDVLGVLDVLIIDYQMHQLQVRMRGAEGSLRDSYPLTRVD